MTIGTPQTLGYANSLISANGVSFTSGNNISTGDTVVVIFGAFTNTTIAAPTPSVVTDGTNSYIKINSNTCAAGVGNSMISIYYKANAVAVNNPTITANTAAVCSGRFITAIKCSGLSAGAFDQSNSQSEASGSSPNTQITTTTASELIVGALVAANNAAGVGTGGAFLYPYLGILWPAPTEGAGFIQIATGNATSFAFDAAYQITSASGTITYNPQTAAANTNAILMASFKILASTKTLIASVTTTSLISTIAHRIRYPQVLAFLSYVKHVHAPAETAIATASAFIRKQVNKIVQGNVKAVSTIQKQASKIYKFFGRVTELYTAVKSGSTIHPVPLAFNTTAITSLIRRQLNKAFSFLVQVADTPTVVLCHFNSNLSDATTRHPTAVTLGTVIVDVTHSVFGGASAKFADNSQLAFQNNRADWQFGTSDYTIDGWWYFTSLSGYPVLLEWDMTGSGVGPDLDNATYWVLNTGALQFFVNDAPSSGNILTTSAGVVTTNVWTHIAFIRHSGVFSIYVNGISVGSAADTNNYNLPNIDPYIGPIFGAGGSWVDEFRVMNGYAAWTSNFTVPAAPYSLLSVGITATAPTRQLFLNSLVAVADDPYTVLLMHMDGPNGSINFIDSTNRHSITYNDVVYIDTTQSEFGGASARLASSDAYLSVANNITDFTLPGDFTIDYWYRPTTALTTDPVSSGAPGSAFQIYILGANSSVGDIRLWNGVDQLSAGNNIIQVDNWYHIAVTRSNFITRLFVNGALMSGLNSGTYNDTTIYSGSGVTIGDASESGDSWFDEFRVINGRAAWIAPFTPPVAPYSLLSVGVNAKQAKGISQPFTASTSAGLTKKVTPPARVYKVLASLLAIQGKAALQTLLSKTTTSFLTIAQKAGLNRVYNFVVTLGIGTGSLARNFNGSSDVITIGSGVNFTPPISISLWAYSTAFAGYFYQGGYGLNFPFGNVDIQFNNPGVATILNFLPFNLNVWNNVVVTYDGTNVIGYINGVASPTTATVSPGTDPLTLGSGFTGYIADFAIWNKVLSTGEVSTLVNGARANTIGENAYLINYLPITGASPEPDLSGSGNPGVLTGTSIVAGPPALFGAGAIVQKALNKTSRFIANYIATLQRQLTLTARFFNISATIQPQKSLSKFAVYKAVAVVQWQKTRARISNFIISTALRVPRAISKTVKFLLMIGKAALTFSGLQAHYSFDDGTATDSGGSSYNGTTVGAPTTILGQIGNALLLDGATQWITLPSDPTGPFKYSASWKGSFTCWFMTSTNGTILDQVSAGHVPALYIGTDGKLYASFFWHGATVDQIVSSGTLNDGNWHFFVGTYDGTTESAYVDGNLIGTQTVSQIDYGAGTYTYTIGYPDSGGWTNVSGYFNGSIDDVQVYNRALSLAEVSAIYARGTNALVSITKKVPMAARFFKILTTLQLPPLGKALSSSAVYKAFANYLKVIGGARTVIQRFYISTFPLGLGNIMGFAGAAGEAAITDMQELFQGGYVLVTAIKNTVRNLNQSNLFTATTTALLQKTFLATKSFGMAITSLLRKTANSVRIYSVAASMTAARAITKVAIGFIESAVFIPIKTLSKGAIGFAATTSNSIRKTLSLFRTFPTTTTALLQRIVSLFRTFRTTTTTLLQKAVSIVRTSRVTTLLLLQKAIAKSAIFLTNATALVQRTTTTVIRFATTASYSIHVSHAPPALIVGMAIIALLQSRAVSIIRSFSTVTFSMIQNVLAKLTSVVINATTLIQTPIIRATIINFVATISGLIQHAITKIVITTIKPTILRQRVIATLKTFTTAATFPLQVQKTLGNTLIFLANLISVSKKTIATIERLFVPVTVPLVYANIHVTIRNFITTITPVFSLQKALTTIKTAAIRTTSLLQQKALSKSLVYPIALVVSISKAITTTLTSLITTIGQTIAPKVGGQPLTFMVESTLSLGNPIIGTIRTFFVTTRTSIRRQLAITRNYIISFASPMNLLCHFDTDFSDTLARHSITPAGGATISATQSQFGGASANFDGSTGYLSLDNSPDFAFGTGDFTIDFWTNVVSGNPLQVLYAGNQDINLGQYSPYINIRDGTWRYNISDALVGDITGGSVSAGWHHIAATRASGSTMLFVDGTQVGSTLADTSDYEVTLPPTIGASLIGPPFYFGGYIDELHIIAGSAAWTSNFTPPTVPYQASWTSIISLQKTVGTGNISTIAAALIRAPATVGKFIQSAVTATIQFMRAVSGPVRIFGTTMSFIPKKAVTFAAGLYQALTTTMVRTLSKRLIRFVVNAQYSSIGRAITHIPVLVKILANAPYVHYGKAYLRSAMAMLTPIASLATRRIPATVFSLFASTSLKKTVKPAASLYKGLVTALAQKTSIPLAKIYKALATASGPRVFIMVLNSIITTASLLRKSVATTLAILVAVTNTITKAITHATIFNTKAVIKIIKQVQPIKLARAAIITSLQRAISTSQSFAVIVTTLPRKAIAASRLALISSQLLFRRMLSQTWLVMTTATVNISKTALTALLTSITVITSSRIVQVTKILLERITVIVLPSVPRRLALNFMIGATTWLLASYIKIQVVLIAMVTTTVSLAAWFIERLKIRAAFQNISETVIAQAKKRTEQIRAFFQPWPPDTD